MARSAELGKAAMNPVSIATKDAFDAVAAAAKVGCPISRVLKGGDYTGRETAGIRPAKAPSRFERSYSEKTSWPRRNN